MASKAAEAGNLSVAGSQFPMVFKARNWGRTSSLCSRNADLDGVACPDVPFLRDMAANKGLDRFTGDYCMKKEEKIVAR